MLVNYAGLSKAEVLAALFNASQPMGMGMFQAGFGPEVMDVEYAEKLVTGESGTPDYPGGHSPQRQFNRRVYFDYVHGRPLKLDLTSDDDTFEPWGFDRDNGGDGAAQRIISALQEAKKNG